MRRIWSGSTACSEREPWGAAEAWGSVWRRARPHTPRSRRRPQKAAWAYGWDWRARSLRVSITYKDGNGADADIDRQQHISLHASSLGSVVDSSSLVSSGWTGTAICRTE